MQGARDSCKPAYKFYTYYFAKYKFIKNNLVLEIYFLGIQVFAHRFGLFLLHLLPGPKMPLATKLNHDRASDALTDDPFGTQSH